MGNQFNFYMAKSTEQRFIDFLLKNGYTFLNENVKDDCIQIVNAENVTNSVFWQFYLIKNESYDNIPTRFNNYSIDYDSFPVIEFTRSRTNDREMKVQRGRIWVSGNFKGTYLLNNYAEIVNWLKKNLTRRNIIKGDALVKEYVDDEMIKLNNDGYRMIL